MEDDEDLGVVVWAIIAMALYLALAYFFLKTAMGAFILLSIFGVVV